MPRRAGVRGALARRPLGACVNIGTSLAVRSNRVKSQAKKRLTRRGRGAYLQHRRLHNILWSPAQHEPQILGFPLHRPGGPDQGPPGADASNETPALVVNDAAFARSGRRRRRTWSDGGAGGGNAGFRPCGRTGGPGMACRCTGQTMAGRRGGWCSGYAISRLFGCMDELGQAPNEKGRYVTFGRSTIHEHLARRSA